MTIPGENKKATPVMVIYPDTVLLMIEDKLMQQHY